MKVEIDTKAKTIRLLETIQIGDFIKEIGEMLGINKWQEYKILYQCSPTYVQPPIITWSGKSNNVLCSDNSYELR